MLYGLKELVGHKIINWIFNAIPEKKHTSSPKRGLYGAHVGAENSTIIVNNKTTKGNPYEETTKFLYLFELEGYPLDKKV